MKVFFRKLFNIYPGEEYNALLFGLLGFLWAFGVTAGYKFADALFLLHIGPTSLPTAYQLTACFMILLAAILLYAFHAISIHKIFISALIIGIAFYLFIEFCFWNNIGVQSNWLWFSLRIFGSLFFTIILTCFWTFVDHYHHLQDSKRMYGLFSSMVFIGIAFTGIIMRSGLISFQQLIIGIIILLGLAIYIINYINRSLKPVQDENESLESSAQSGISLRSQIKSILTSRFTLLLMAGNFLTYVLLVITEYSYMSSFTAALDPQGIISTTGEEQNARLTQFLGQWIAIASVCNIIIGLFLYGRLVRRFGVGSLVFCSPIILLATYTGRSLSDSLLFPIMGLFVVEGTLYVIDDSNFNLLLNAVPSKLKYKIRLLIESFFEPIGMLVSSFLLSVSWMDSKWLGLILSGVLFAVVVAIRANYLQGIYKNLAENAIHFHRSVCEWFTRMKDKERKTTEKRLLAIVRQGNEQQLPLAIAGLLSFNNGHLQPEDSIIAKLLKQIDLGDRNAKISFISALLQNNFPCNSLILEYLHEWNQDKISIIDFYLASQEKLPPEAINDHLNNPDPILQGAAILALKLSQLHQKAFAQNENLERKLQSLLDSNEEHKICIGLQVLSLSEKAINSRSILETADQDAKAMQDLESTTTVSKLIHFMQHPLLKVRQTAAAMLAQINTPLNTSQAHALITLLTTSSDPDFRLNCIKALGKFEGPSLTKEIISASIHFRPSERRETENIIAKKGSCTVPTLVEMINDTKLHDRCRVLASKILGRLDLPLLRENVYAIIKIEIERAYFYFYHYHTIQENYPALDLHVLQDALLTGYHSVLDFIIQLLGVSGEIEDCELLSRSLRSPHPKIWSQVMETIERTCETRIFRLLSPLLSDLPDKEKLNAYRMQGHESLPLDKLLDRLETFSGYVDQIVAAALKYRFNMPGWRTSLTKKMSTQEDIFRHFSQELLET